MRVGKCAPYSNLMKMANNNEISKRRTFAIISHPDAGKTTLTEKLLLFGGAIHVAGAVKSNKIKNDLTIFYCQVCWFLGQPLPSSLER